MPFVETNGIRTYYEEYGAGPPVVLLHGGWGDHRLWAEQAEPLTKDYRVIVYDLRGHGRTGGSEDDFYTVRQYAQDLNALIRALSLDRPAVCGRSLGGFVALSHATLYPETISALCLIGAETPEAQTRREWFERRIPKRTIVDALSEVVDRDRIASAIHRFNQWRYGTEAAGNMSEIERILQSHAEDVPNLSETEAAKIHEAVESYPSERLDYSAVTVPSLILYGEHEIPLIRRHAEFTETVIPHAEVKQIPNAGHVSTVDNPEFVIESLRELLVASRPATSPE